MPYNSSSPRSLSPRIFPIVLAFAGDSTINKFLSHVLISALPFWASWTLVHPVPLACKFTVNSIKKLVTAGTDAKVRQPSAMALITNYCMQLFWGGYKFMKQGGGSSCKK